MRSCYSSPKEFDNFIVGYIVMMAMH